MGQTHGGGTPEDPLGKTTLARHTIIVLKDALEDISVSSRWYGFRGRNSFRKIAWIYERLKEYSRENPEGNSKRWEQRAPKWLPGILMVIHVRIVHCTARTAELTYPIFLTDIAPLPVCKIGRLYNT